jgi:hypothetical protein
MQQLSTAAHNLQQPSMQRAAFRECAQRQALLLAYFMCVAMLNQSYQQTCCMLPPSMEHAWNQN